MMLLHENYTLVNSLNILSLGSFKNCADKMRWVDGQKMPIFVHIPVKNVHIGRLVVKKGENYFNIVDE